MTPYRKGLLYPYKKANGSNARLDAQHKSNDHKAFGSTESGLPVRVGLLYQMARLECQTELREPNSGSIEIYLRVSRIVGRLGRQTDHLVLELRVRNLSINLGFLGYKVFYL